VETISIAPVLWGGITQKGERKTVAESGQTHYYEVTGLDPATGRAVRHELSFTSAPDVIAQLRELDPGDRVHLLTRSFPVRCKRARQDGSLYDTTLFSIEVVGAEAEGRAELRAIA
jgi:hypothetical protein